MLFAKPLRLFNLNSLPCSMQKITTDFKGYKAFNYWLSCLEQVHSINNFVVKVILKRSVSSHFEKQGKHLGVKTMHFNFGAGFIKWVKVSLHLSTWLFSCFALMFLLVLEFMLRSRTYLIPFLEYSASLVLVRWELFTGGRGVLELTLVNYWVRLSSSLGLLTSILV